MKATEAKLLEFLKDSFTDLPYVMGLVWQSFNKQMGEAGDV